MPRSLWLLGSLALVACGDSGASSVCDSPAETLGKQVCVDRIASEQEWQALASEVAAVDQRRSTRYIVPARSESRLPTLIEDATAGFMGHYQFLREAFPELFPGLSLDDYTDLVLAPGSREFYAGRITEYIDPEGATIYGFIVWSEQSAADTLSCEGAQNAYAALSQAISLRPLAIVPTDDFQRTSLQGCDLPFYDASMAVEYEAYSPKKVYGRIRRYRLAELAPAALQSEFGYQDILVIDQAPIDIETIVSGTVTGERQGELSHLNVRASSRGTANCYLRGAYQRLQAYEGKIVALECAANQLLVSEASEEDAQRFWDELRPAPVAIPQVDASVRSMASLLTMATESQAEREASLRAYGAKAKNLATLYQRTPAHEKFPGFAIPFVYYQEFMAHNDLNQRLVDMLGNPDFRSDAQLRRVQLDAYRSEIEAGSCDQDMLLDLSARIDEVFGGPDAMLRFRSSSNAEDTLAFNGAGLYQSTSVCPADDRDQDSAGPSRCDPSKSQERGLCRGLKKVWASLWTSKAFDERDWYSMDHSLANMAILVNPRSANEQANIVAFTENPFAKNDRHYLVNAQEGELEVVGEPGVSPEKDLLRIDPDSGELLEVIRARPSSAVPVGAYVLSDAELRRLAFALWEIQAVFPVDESPPAGKRVILDTEWKITSDGRLVAKQVRPFASE